jgi:hypothetical protein
MTTGLSNDHKIVQKDIKYTNIFHSKLSKMPPNLDLGLQTYHMATPKWGMYIGNTH